MEDPTKQAADLVKEAGMYIENYFKLGKDRSNFQYDSLECVLRVKYDTIEVEEKYKANWIQPYLHTLSDIENCLLTFREMPASFLQLNTNESLTINVRGRSRNLEISFGSVSNMGNIANEIDRKHIQQIKAVYNKHIWVIGYDRLSDGLIVTCYGENNWTACSFLKIEGFYVEDEFCVTNVIKKVDNELYLEYSSLTDVSILAKHIIDEDSLVEFLLSNATEKLAEISSGRFATETIAIDHEYERNNDGSTRTQKDRTYFAYDYGLVMAERKNVDYGTSDLDFEDDNSDDLFWEGVNNWLDK